MKNFEFALCYRVVGKPCDLGVEEVHKETQERGGSAQRESRESREKVHKDTTEKSPFCALTKFSLFNSLTMAKKGKKGAKAGDWDDDDIYQQEESQELGQQVPEETNENGSLEPPQEEKKEEEEEESSGDFLTSIRSSKKKKEEKEKEEAKKDSDAPKILSKKEKEKLKKEAEKLKKKEQNAKKKAQQQEKKDQIKEANKKNAAASGSGDKEEVAEGSEASEGVESSETTPTPAKAPAKKGKKAPAGLSALKKQLEMKKQLEDEQRRLEEEEEEKERKAEQLAKEEEDRLEASRAAKKEKDRLKKEQLKAEGKLLTKKQKEEKKLQERRRQQLLQNSNVQVAGLSQSEEKVDVPKPKKVVYGKKKASKTNDEDKVKSTKKESKDTKKDDGEEDDAILDDWENLLDDEQPEEGEEQEKEEEQEQTPTTPATQEPTEAEIQAKEEAKAKAAEAKQLAKQEAEAKAQEEKALSAKKEAEVKRIETRHPDKDLRSPICCILGHVDTGKTKLLDKVRQTNVQGGEAGGITQQIGATYFPIDAIKQKTDVMAKYEKRVLDVPGLLIIDTPGHESFTNLRSRGSSLCNIAILVIDIMHGLEPQTLESLRLLRDRKAPFVVALNKIDRLFDWDTTPYNSFRDSFEKQSKSVQSEFYTRLDQIKLALSEQGLNSELYYENKNMAKYVSIVPTSAVTGEGVPDLLWLLLELTQKRMSKQLMYLTQIEATILEVKMVEGFGYTIDVILSNGYLREGDRIVLCGLNGPIATNIRALLTPPPSKEIRIKSEYVHNKEVKAALGVKIAANDLEKAVAGSRLVVVGEDDDEEEIMEEVMDDLTGLLDSVDTSGRGVTVQASTLGSLEALLDFLKALKIPVMSIGLGPVYKRDVMKAGAMTEKAPEYAVMLCFDVKIDKEAEQYANEQHIKLFNADIIYHLFDAFTNYQAKLLEQRRKDFMDYAVFPCVMKTIQIINKRNPMLIGVDVVEGAVRIGTPICAVRTDPTTKTPNIMVLGKVVSLEVNHKSMDQVKKGQTAAGVAMRLENPSSAQPVWGRHVDETDNLYSLISRKSIDTLKDPAFRDSVSKEDWLLIKKLKPVFDIK